jgi:hypothetical protein
MTRSLKRGQIWVVSDIRKNNVPGQLVLILSHINDTAFIVPVHYYLDKRTFHDLIINADIHSAFIPGPLVVITSLTMCVSANVFSEENACLVGEIYQEGLKLIEEKLQVVEKAEMHLANLRMKDSLGTGVTFEEDIAAVEAGAYNILPVDGDIAGYKKFYHSVFDILEPWHIMAQQLILEESVQKTVVQKVKNFIVRIKQVCSDWETVTPLLSGAGSRDDLPSSLPFSIDGIGSFSITFRLIDTHITMILEGENTDEVLKRVPVINIVYNDGHQEKHTFSIDYISKDITIRESNIISIDIEFTKEG